MPKISRVELLKQIKSTGTWTFAPALFDGKGRVRYDHVRVNGVERSPRRRPLLHRIPGQGKTPV